MSTLTIVPVSLAQARAFVDEHHRHLDAPRGHKFSIGVASESVLVGVAIVGRPIARVIDAEGDTLEVRRTATDGTYNANSMLYGACWRATKALGYRRLITYTQEGETGASLRAAGFHIIGERPSRAGWDMPSRPRTQKPGVDHIPRTLWETTNHHDPQRSRAPRSATEGT